MTIGDANLACGRAFFSSMSVRKLDTSGLARREVVLWLGGRTLARYGVLLPPEAESVNVANPRTI